MLDGMRTAWETTHAQWGVSDPGDFEAFARHVDILQTDDTHAADLVLAWCCGHGRAPALRTFEDTLVPVAERAVARVDADAVFVDECAQRIRTRLLVPDNDQPPRILRYAGRGPLAGWVSVAAVRVALSLIRQTQRQAARDEQLWSEAVLFPSGLGADLQHLKERYASQLGEGLRQACAELEERDRAVLRLFFAEGLNIDKIGKVYGVHRATVARWIARIKTTLIERMHTIMHAEQGIPVEELTSIDRLVRSQLEISLTSLLR